MIGTEDNARTITAIDWWTRENEDGDIRLDSIGDVPEGWEYIGSGAYRHAFRSPDGYVYKVPTACGRTTYTGSNEHSWDVYSILIKFAHETGVRVAACDYFTESNVMAQEYVEGDVCDPDLDEDYFDRADSIHRISKSIGHWMDVHSNNFLVVEGETVLIDW